MNVVVGLLGVQISYIQSGVVIPITLSTSVVGLGVGSGCIRHYKIRT